MKGVLFTLTIFIVMGFAIAYFALTAFSNIERSSIASEKLAAQRIFYTWMGVADNFQSLLNVTIEKNDSDIIINDTLPSTEDKVKNLLTRYQQFIDQYIEDPTIFIRFEDISGNPTDLNQTQPQIVIKPMNINYSWPDYGKNQMFLKSSPENFSFIRNITYEITVNSSFVPHEVPNPKSCPAQYCLNFTLRIKNSSYTWEWGAKQHDIQFNNWVELDVGGTETVARVDVGDIDPPANVVLHINIIKQEYVLDTHLDILFNTTQLYIDFPTKLNVTSIFGKKVDFL